MEKKTTVATETYFQNQPQPTQKTLLALRRIILKTAPHAEELLNYGIPAYALAKGGKRDKQIMIAGYKNFAGFYTGTGVLEHFAKQLSVYKTGKASVQFPNDKPLPERLIAGLVKFRQQQVSGEKARAKPAKK